MTRRLSIANCRFCTLEIDSEMDADEGWKECRLSKISHNFNCTISHRINAWYPQSMCMPTEAQCVAHSFTHNPDCNSVQSTNFTMPESLLSTQSLAQTDEARDCVEWRETQTHNQSILSDLSRSDPMSEIYQRKVTKAKRAIENAATARSISKTLAGKGMKHQLFFVSHDLPSKFEIQ